MLNNFYTNKWRVSRIQFTVNRAHTIIYFTLRVSYKHDDQLSRNHDIKNAFLCY